MLQRAASNAYSWWWASHVRTKQSKWLEQSLQDMEEKVNDTLQIINEEGDTFAQRAEMYYRKRPELVNFVEESFRAYRALAERYDKLSRELQSANHTIATVFPEQVQLAMDEEDEENLNQISNRLEMVSKDVSNVSIPKVPQNPDKIFRSPSMVISKRGQLKRAASSTKATTNPKSGLSKTEALKEIDRFQKGILVKQTEKEFVKSWYEEGYAKYWEIENQITEMQGNVSRLQDEFGIGTVIEDNEARSLMAATALKTCQENLAMLQEKHELSAEEAKAEYQKINEAHKKLETMKDEFISKYSNPDAFPENSLDLESFEQRHDNETVHESIKENLDVNSNMSIGITELAEKIDELVDKVVTLATTVSSQNALVKRLSSETDELQLHIRNLEEDKDILMESSDIMRNKLIELEEELKRVKNLNQSVKEQNNNLRTHFSEACRNLDHLSEKLQTAKLDEDVEDGKLFEKVKPDSDAKPQKETEEQNDKPMHVEEIPDVEGKKEGIPVQPVASNLEDENGSVDKSKATNRNFEDEIETEEEVDQQKWRQRFVNGLEDREKMLVEEYTSVLRNYKDVKKKLSEVEMKNRDSLFELAMQVKELKDVNASREEELQSLREKLFPQANPDENQDCTSIADTYSQKEGPQETPLTSSPCSIISSRNSPDINYLEEKNNSSEQRISRSDTRRTNLESPSIKEEIDSIKGEHPEESYALSTVEEIIRTDIDELLEENLEFWLRFCTSIHQIQKFQCSAQDLKDELARLKENKKTEGSHTSDVRPIYRHLREIQTELTLWLEHNSVLKEELQTKFSSLHSIQEAISRVSYADSKGEEAELSRYQAAKFQGEVLNMKQEINKISDELESGLHRVGGLKAEVENTLQKLDEELRPQLKPSASRHRIPLRSFLFGVKLKRQKQSLFSCMSPSLQKQYSDLAAANRPL